MAHVKVTGTVDKPLGDKGFILIETAKTFDGRTFPKQWNIWSTPIPEFSSTVEVVGELTALISEFEVEGQNRRKLALNVNNPTVTVTAPPTQASFDVNTDGPTPNIVTPF